MSNIEEYRIKKGQIIYDKIIPFDFGIVSNNDGFFEIEIYVSDDFDLLFFMNNDYKKNLNQDYKVECLTVENNELFIDRLRFNSIKPSVSTVKMTSYGKLRHVKTKDFPDEHRVDKPKIHYLELEGLKMEFCEITEEVKYRSGQESEEFPNYNRDHTTSLLRYQNFPYNMLFYKCQDSDNIIVEFPDKSNNTLTYEKFKEIKNDFISAISFLNGAIVKVRKECTGSYYTLGKIDAEIVIKYSFKNIVNQKYNRYIPLNNPWHRGTKVLNALFFYCYDDFVKWNQRLDLNTIIFYLNNSEQSKSMDEKIFIQIIAFERLTTRYAEFLGQKEEFKPNKKSFEPIKQKLLEIIDEYKSEFDDAYDIVKSKIGNLNQIRKLSTKEKMYKLIHDVEIPIDSRISNLIDNVRNSTIHRGDFGKDKEALVNYYLLDELIREIILRLIKYNGVRESIVLMKNKNTKA